MYKFLLHAFRFFDFCTVKGFPRSNGVVVFCDPIPAGAAVPESFNTLIDYCATVCDSFDWDDDDDFARRTYYFGDIRLYLVFELDQ